MNEVARPISNMMDKLLAFLFLIAGLTVAYAISFGIGGREFAKRQLEKLEAKMDKENDKPNL